MSLISFGEYVEGKNFKVLNERVVRGTAGLMLILGLFALVNGFVLKNYIVIPYISGFLAFNFLISIIINPKVAPLTFIAGLMVRKQTPIYMGAIQKKFAFSLGSILTLIIFGLSFLLFKDDSYFNNVCFLCVICNILLFLETAFAVCVGCWLYKWAIKFKLIPTPKERPNCMGDSCDINE